MRLAVRRVPAFLLVLVLTVASMAPVTAQTVDTVTVTGEIVGVPLSITISDTPVAFGNVNYLATAQTGTIAADGFLATENNGAIWVSRTPVSITVTSPAAWSSTVCVSTASGIRPQMFRLLNAIPADDAAANTAVIAGTAMISENCASPSAWIQNAPAGANNSYTKYIAAWVQAAETPGTMSATITFTVSN